MSSTTSDSPAWLPKTCLSSSMIDAGRRAASRQTSSGCGPAGSRAAAARASSTSSGVGLKGSTAWAISDVPLSPWSTRPRTMTTSSTPRTPSYSASALPKMRTSIEPSRSSRVANIIGSPFFVRIFLAAVMMPPAVTQSPSRLPGSSASGQSTVGAQRLAHLLERVRRDEQADRLLLDGQQLGLVELLARDRRVRRGREGRRAAARVAAHRQVEDRALPDLRVELGLLAGGLGLLEHAEHALARVARAAERAALDERLDRALVHRARVDARAEVPDAT